MKKLCLCLVGEVNMSAPMHDTNLELRKKSFFCTEIRKRKADLPSTASGKAPEVTTKKNNKIHSNTVVI